MNQTQRSEKYPLQYGANNPILRSKVAPADHTNPYTQEVIKALIQLIHDYNGVGLAAPQIGQDMRIIAITERNKKGKKMLSKTPVILINPTIIKHGNETIIGEEGCLSLPNTYGNVERWKEITVTYTTTNGEEKTQERSGFTSVIVQHEIDHLDGILFVDKTIS